MATIRHCSTLEFGRGGAYNQAVAPGITRPLHASDLGEKNIITETQVFPDDKTLKVGKAAGCNEMRPEMFKLSLEQR